MVICGGPACAAVWEAAALRSGWSCRFQAGGEWVDASVSRKLSPGRSRGEQADAGCRGDAETTERLMG
jgi:hypothetical protein